MCDWQVDACSWQYYRSLKQIDVGLLGNNFWFALALIGLQKDTIIRISEL